MKIERVIVNASPLIVLFKSGLAELLPRLFTEVLVPGAVWDEVLAGAPLDVAAQQLPTVTWAQRTEVDTIPMVVAEWNLGAGEAEVLSLALSRPGYYAMLDDAAARACARTFRIPLLGTGGALILAKRHGLLPSVMTALDALRTAGLWLSAEVEQLLKQEAGE